MSSLAVVLLPKMVQTNAVSRQASMPKVSHPVAARHCQETMALAKTPLTTMPAPGPVYITPPSAVAPRSASWARHQPEVKTKTTALATPAAKRSAGHMAGAGSAIASASTMVAARPVRTSAGASDAGRFGTRAAIQGWTMHSRAPNR